MTTKLQRRQHRVLIRQIRQSLAMREPIPTDAEKFYQAKDWIQTMAQKYSWRLNLLIAGLVLLLLTLAMALRFVLSGNWK